MTLTAEQLTLHDATSASLRAIFRTVAETDAEGIPKYSPTTCKTLAKTIACRIYAPAILELCHLVNIADSCGGGRDRIERFFWDSGAARTANFRSYLDRAVAAGGWRRSGFERLGSEIGIAYPDGEFTVSFGRMPFLSALAEFLLTALGYQRVDAVFTTLLAVEPTRKSVSDCANELSRIVYDFLKDHLPTAQYQRKFHQLVDFAAERLGENFGPNDIDDATVFAFWQAKSLVAPSEAVDFRTYQTVFRSFVRLFQSLERAREIIAVEDPAVLGTDREAGEIDPETVSAAVDQIEEPVDALKALEETALDRVKLLNKAEFAELLALFDSSQILATLKRSHLRNEVFGLAQRRITQALRRKPFDSSVAVRIRDSSSENYEASIRRYGELLNHSERILLASLYCLLRQRNPEAVTIIFNLLPQIDLSGLADSLNVSNTGMDNVATLSATSVANHFVRILEDPDRSGRELSNIVVAARKAFKGLSRQGFHEDEVDEAAVGEAMEASARYLTRIRNDLQHIVALFQSASHEVDSWSRAFESDSAIFYDQFTAIY